MKLPNEFDTFHSMKMEARPRTRLDSELIKECARRHNLSDRAVRAWRAKQDPRWVKFISERASEGLGQLEAVALRPELENSTPEAETRAAQRRFALIQRELDRATEAGRFAEIPILNRTAESAHKLLMLCRTAEVDFKRVCGSLIDKSQFDELTRRFLLPVTDALKSMPNELCLRANPTAPEVANSVLTEWVFERIGPLIAEALSATQKTNTGETNSHDHHQEN